MESVKLERIETIDLDLEEDDQNCDKNNFTMADAGFNDLIDSIGDGTKKTKETEKFGIGVFQAYLEAQGINLDAVLAGGDDGQDSALTLDEIIAQFYPSARTKGGNYYSKNSIMLIRFALARYIMKVKNVDITDPTQFPNACMSFKLTIKKLESEGKGETKHHEPVSDEDMRIIQASLDLDDNVGLQRKVFIDVMLYFCNRERDHLRSMKPGDLIFQKCDDGREYVELCNTKTKNFGNGRSRNKIIEIPGHPRCPVKTLKKYLSKLDPTRDALFQRPKSKFCKDLKIWYDNAVIGRNNLSKLMKIISEEAGCKTIYTNHCLCTTSISNLYSLGYSSQNTPPVNGQFVETTVSHCSRTNEKNRIESGSSNWGTGIDAVDSNSTTYIQQREILNSLDMDDSISDEGVSIIENEETEYIKKQQEQQQYKQQQQRLQQQHQQRLQQQRNQQQKQQQLQRYQEHQRQQLQHQQQLQYNNPCFVSSISTTSLHSPGITGNFDFQQHRQQQDTNVSYVVSSPSSNLLDTAGGKRRLDSNNSIDNNSIVENSNKKSKQPEEKDDIDHFFCSMAETMRQLPNRTRAELKFKIHQLVHQAELDTMYS